MATLTFLAIINKDLKKGFNFLVHLFSTEISLEIRGGTKSPFYPNKYLKASLKSTGLI